MSSEWEDAWAATTGAASEEAPELGSAGGEHPPPASPALPAEGQVWLDAINPPNFEWVVDSVEGELVTLQMLRDGELTQSVLVWPLNRWPALVEKQRLSLKAAA